MIIPPIPEIAKTIGMHAMETVVKLVFANGDKDKELDALMDAADKLADEIERRKFNA